MCLFLAHRPNLSCFTTLISDGEGRKQDVQCLKQPQQLTVTVSSRLAVSKACRLEMSLGNLPAVSQAICSDTHLQV